MFAKTIACRARRRRMGVTVPLQARLALSSVMAIALFGTPASAAEVRLLSAAAMQSVLKDLAGEFERTSGHTLRITYTTMGAITQSVLGGETADLMIGSGPSI